jgi:WD40 repeat protein
MSPLRISIVFSLIVCAGQLTAEPLPRPDPAGDAPLPEHAVARLGITQFWHGAPISCLAVSADGKYIASGSDDRSVRVWDADTGKLLRVVRCLSSPVGVAFSPTGKELITNIDNEEFPIFDWATDKPPRAIMKSANRQTVVWSKDGKHIALVGDDKADIYEAASGKMLHSLEKAMRLGFAGDGKTYAVAFPNGDIHLRAINDGDVKELAAKPEQGSVVDVRFSDDGNLLLAKHTSGAVVVWDLKTATRLHTLTASGSLTLVPGQAKLVAADKVTVGAADSQLVMMDLKSGERKVMGINVPDDAPIAFLPDGNRLVTGGPGNRVRIWSLTTGKEIVFGDDHDGEITGLAYAPDGKSLLAAGQDGMRLWDVQTFRERAGARRSLPVQALSLTPGGRRFITTGAKNVNIWAPVDFAKDNPYADRPSLTIAAGLERMPVLAHSPDGNRIAFADAGKKLVFADPMRGTTFQGLTLSSDPLAAAFAPNGRFLAVHTRDGWLRHWMLGLRDGGEVTDTEIWTKRVQRGSRGAVAYSPDGLLVAVFSGGRVVLVDSVNGRQWHGFEREFGEGDVQALAFSPDGRFVAAGHGGPDGFVRIWEVLTGKPLVTLRGHVGGVNAIAFAPDGKQVASAGSDSTVLLWNPALKPSPEDKPLTPAEAWDTLDSQDIKAAYRAMAALASAGPKSVAVIQAGAREALANQARMRDLIRQLEDDDFRVRRKARAALEKEGARALPALHESLTRKLPIDTERLVRLIIDEMDGRDIRIPETGLFGESLRTVRSIRILERIGGADALGVLEKLAASREQDRVAAEAKAALEYLRR